MAQRKERAVRILGSEEVMGIGLPELMARLQEEGTELSGEEGLALAQAMGQEEPYFFRLDDLASEAFDKKLSEIQAEKLKARQAAEAAKREEERQAAANAASSSASPASQADEVVNDDRSSFGAINWHCIELFHVSCVIFLLKFNMRFTRL